MSASEGNFGFASVVMRVRAMECQIEQAFMAHEASIVEDIRKAVKAMCDPARIEAIIHEEIQRVVHRRIYDLVGAAVDSQIDEMRAKVIGKVREEMLGATR